MRARMQRWVWGVVVIGGALPGCSTTCSWFGRNSDCSNNCWGKKPTPVQQGPIAGTYSQPSNGAMTGAPPNYQQSAANGQQGTALPGQIVTSPSPQVPVFTTTPATTAPNAMPPSPLNTPSLNPPRNGLAPAGTPLPGTPVSFRQLPPAELNAPASSNMMDPTGPVVKAPEIPSPPLDLNVPAAMTSKKADPADAMVKPTSIPMLLGPNDADRSVRNNGPTVQAPNVAPPPAIPVPTVPAPNVLPSVTSNGVPMTPPPLPPAAPPAPRLE